MIWSAFGGTLEDDEALLLLLRPQELDGCPSAINALTITRIKVHLLGDEKKGDQEHREPMETETEVEEQPLSLRGRGIRS